ncbi:hypothetical protein FACS189491_10060 [Spirochaetia bacterium]|nr:hypothetical protein FACS189491_10060 [Spirochaetia bacterium]
MTIFFADNPEPRIAAFTKEYRTRYNNAAPNYFVTTAYESLALIEAALRAGATDRASLYQELLKIKEWDGDTGYATYDDDRMVNRAMTIIKVQNGSWVWAPEAQ